jgi:peptide subunit release factor 1 (eRF1)
MGNYRYITNRTIMNKAGEETGNIGVLVPNDSDQAKFKYKCPECGHKEMGEKEWKRPFSVKCAGCGVIIRLPRLKDALKKEKRDAKKKAEAAGKTA